MEEEEEEVQASPLKHSKVRHIAVSTPPQLS